MRLLLATVIVMLTLSGCGASDEQAREPVETTASATSTAAAAAEEDAPLAAACEQHCALLAEAQDRTCPDPLNNVKACVPYLTELAEAVYDVRDALDEVPYAARDHADLLEAVNSHVEAVEKFAADRCFEITSASVDSGFACGMQPLSIIWSAATVGLRLQAAATA